MKPVDIGFSYPPLRKKIFKQALLMIGLYFLVGMVMVAAVFLASGITPGLIHLDYDSIMAAKEMNVAWNALRHRALVVSFILFSISIFISLLLADRLAIQIANPLKELAETLRRKPLPGTKLKMPQPTSLEMRILTHELTRLWERLSELQKLNLEEIYSHRGKLEAVLSSVDDAILALDNQEQVVLCNTGIQALISLEPEEILGRRWGDLSTVSQNYIKLREALKPEISSDDLIYLNLDRKTHIFSGRCRPFFGKNQELIGRLYLLHDITEIRQRDRMKTEFLAVLSHELRTPLQSLGTASELLLERMGHSTSESASESVIEAENAPDKENKMLIQTICEDVKRIGAVANEFAQVGLVDLHSLKLKLERIPISDYLQQWIQPFQIIAKDKDIKVELVKEGSQVIFGQVDIVKFPWAISNLVSNAIRVSPPRGTVVIYLTDRESRVDIEVRDEGPGISEEMQKKIFDPYFQGASETGGFLGLGLTVTKEVVEAHEGRIEYFAKVPQGSIFRISLPLVH